MENGTLTVSTIKQRRLIETGDQKDDDTIEDFIAKVTYFPGDRKRTGKRTGNRTATRTGSMFTATVRQQTLRHGGFFSIPRLQANFVLPSDSLVFQLVQEGRLAEFEALLRQGKASLRDHDELGNSLLAVSLIAPPASFLFEGF